MKNKSELINEYIIDGLGPQRALPLHWLIVLTIVYIVILISGLIGNIVTILVIFRFRYMQTITNLYLCNLAITDLISLMFSLPLELYTLWHQYPWQLGNVMCSLKTLILEGTANASVLTLVTFTVERYLAICGPSKSGLPTSTQSMFHGRSLTKIKRIACRNIALIWTISICGATPLVLLTRINYLEYESMPLKQSAWCGLAYNEPDKRWELIMLSSTVAFFLIPLIIISLLYYIIARKLKQATRLDAFQSDMQLTDHATSRKLIQSRKIVIRMLVVIVIVFTFCWSPFHAQRLLFLYVTLYSNWNIATRQINGILFLSAGCLYYLNSSLNPLIYSLLSTRFRAAFTLYVNGCCGGQSLSVSGQSTSQPQGQQQPKRLPNKSNNCKSNSNNSVLLVNGALAKNQTFRSTMCLNNNNAPSTNDNLPCFTADYIKWKPNHRHNRSNNYARKAKSSLYIYNKNNGNNNYSTVENGTNWTPDAEYLNESLSLPNYYYCCNNTNSGSSISNNSNSNNSNGQFSSNNSKNNNSDVSHQRFYRLHRYPTGHHQRQHLHFHYYCKNN